MDARKELTEFAYKTMCTKRPECCTPRDIEMVAWDADNTLWYIKPYGIASGITEPLKVIDENTLEVTRYPRLESKAKGKPPKETKPSGFRKWRPKREWQMEFEPEVPTKPAEPIKPTTVTPPLSPHLREIITDLYPGVEFQEYPEWHPEEKSVREPTRITLLPTVRETLEELKKRGISQTIISLNRPGSVKRILEAFGLADYFTEVNDTWDNKGKIFDEAAARHHVCPCNALFVDDQPAMVETVTKKCGLALQIGPSGDIKEPIQVLDYILKEK